MELNEQGNNTFTTTPPKVETNILAVCVFNELMFFRKSFVSIIEVWQGPKYISESIQNFPDFGRESFNELFGE